MRSKLDSIIAAGLIFAVVFSAAAFGSVEPWSISILELIVAILTMLWFVKWIREKEVAVDLPPLLIPLAGLIVWGLIQNLPLALGAGPGKTLSLDPGSTSRFIQVLFFMTLAFTLSVNTFNRSERYRLLAGFLSFYAFALAVFALVQHFTWSGAYYWIRPSLIEGFGPFANRDHFAGYMELLGPIPIALVLMKSVDRQKRAIYVFATLISVIAVLASLSRGGVLSLLAESVFLLVWTARRRAHIGTDRSIKTKADYLAHAAIAGAILGVIGIGFYWIGAEPILNRAQDTLLEVQTSPGNYTSRRWIWSDTLSMTKAHPVSGIGLGAFRTVFPAFSHGNGSQVVAQSHNDYLQILADGGIVGALIAIGFLAMLFQAMKKALRSTDRVAAGLALGCSAGLAGIMVHSLFDFNLQIPSNALLFLVFTAIVSSIGAARSERRNLAEPDLMELNEKSPALSRAYVLNTK